MAYQKYNKTTPSKVQFLAWKMKKYKQLKKQTNKQTNKQRNKEKQRHKTSKKNLFLVCNFRIFRGLEHPNITVMIECEKHFLEHHLLETFARYIFQNHVREMILFSNRRKKF